MNVCQEISNLRSKIIVSGVLDISQHGLKLAIVCSYLNIANECMILYRLVEGKDQDCGHDYEDGFNPTFAAVKGELVSIMMCYDEIPFHPLISESYQALKKAYETLE